MTCPKTSTCLLWWLTYPRWFYAHCTRNTAKRDGYVSERDQKTSSATTACRKNNKSVSRSYVVRIFMIPSSNDLKLSLRSPSLNQPVLEFSPFDVGSSKSQLPLCFSNSLIITDIPKKWNLLPWQLGNHSIPQQNSRRRSITWVERTEMLPPHRTQWKKPLFSKEGVIGRKMLMAEILHHLGCMKPYKYWDKLPINWCRISAINSIQKVSQGQGLVNLKITFSCFCPHL